MLMRSLEVCIVLLIYLIRPLGLGLVPWLLRLRAALFVLGDWADS